MRRWVRGEWIRRGYNEDGSSNEYGRKRGEEMNGRETNSLECPAAAAGQTLPSARAPRAANYTVMQKIWLLWEKLAGWGMKLGCDYVLEFGICKVMVKRHTGEAIDCEDGTRIEPGDRIGELHLDNRQMLELARTLGPDRAALQTARLARASLKRIDEAMETRPELIEVKALVGVTLLHRGLIHGLGFECKPLPSKGFERTSTVYLQTLLRFMHPEGANRVSRSKQKLTPLMLVHTRESLRISMARVRSDLS